MSKTSNKSRGETKKEKPKEIDEGAEAGKDKEEETKEEEEEAGRVQGVQEAQAAILQLQEREVGRVLTAQQSQQVPEIQAVQVIPLTILYQATIQTTVAKVKIDEGESLRGEREITVHTSNKRERYLVKRDMMEKTKEAKDHRSTRTCVPSVAPEIIPVKCAHYSHLARRDAKYANCFIVPISVIDVIRLVQKH